MSDKTDRFTTIALPWILRIEGGYVCDPTDPGGETSMGISRRAYPGEDIENMTRERAAEIYRRDYWDACRCGELPPGIDLVVFDAAVNHGVYRAVYVLQRTLGVTKDGQVGPETLRAAVAAHVPAIVCHYLVRRAREYVALLAFSRFGEGWLSRLFQLQDLISRDRASHVSGEYRP